MLERTLLNLFLTFDVLDFKAKLLKKKKKEVYFEDVETKTEKQLILFTKVI